MEIMMMDKRVHRGRTFPLLNPFILVFSMMRKKLSHGSEDAMVKLLFCSFQMF